jgi:hypothetical protein
MAHHAPSGEGYERRIAELEAVVAKQAELLDRQSEVVDHRPQRGEGCGAELGEGTPSERHSGRL